MSVVGSRHAPVPRHAIEVEPDRNLQRFELVVGALPATQAVESANGAVALLSVRDGTDAILSGLRSLLFYHQDQLA